MLRLICSAIDIMAGPADFPQVFRLGIECTANGHRRWEPHVALLDSFFFTQFCSLAENPCMVDDIAGHHGMLRDIGHIHETHPWFQPPPESEYEEEVEVGWGGVVEQEEQEDGAQ